MMTPRFRTPILALAALLHALPARALGPATPIASYHHDMFGSRADAPRDALVMAQTADGWLWFGTPSGLYRYDGVRFEAFRPPRGERLLGQFITALVPHPNGELWIGYLYGGLSVLRDGHLHHIATEPGKPIGSLMAVAFDGAEAWAASASGLWRYRGGTWTHAGAAQGFPDRFARAVYRDQYGRLWAADPHKVYLLDRNTGRFEAVMDTAQDPLVTESPDGRVWVVDGRTVRTLPPPAGGWRPKAPSPVRLGVVQNLFDRDGNYWVGNCPVGLCVRRPASIPPGQARFPDVSGDERLDQPGQLARMTVLGTMEDREGNLWITTPAGVERLRDSPLVPVPMPSGSDWPTLALDGDGGVWLTPDNQGVRGRLWRLRDGIPVEQSTGQQSRVVTGGRDGTVLVGGDRWIERRRGDRLVERIPMPRPGPGETSRNDVLLLAEDRDGIWLYLAGRGMYRLRGGAWNGPSSHPWLGKAIYAFVDGAGRGWFGTRDNGVVMVDGEQRRTYGPEQGIALGAVTFVDASRELLLGGDGGMAVWQGGRFRPLRADGVDLANVSGLLVTPDGDRWLNTRRGLLHVGAADWQRSMADPARPLRGVLWDEMHGFPGTGFGISPVPTLRQGPDGRIWVVGMGGVSWLDRTRVRANAVAPVAEVQALTANGRRHEGGAAGLLAAGTERLRIDYTAPSLRMPERVRFRYRLQGADAGWQEAGTLRTAYYTNLGPGDYRFEVQAINEDGVAGPVAATPPFRIAPTFVQTRWFTLLCVLLGGAAAWLLYLLRLARLKRAWQARMEERLAERARIARTLHDTFLQSLQGLMLRLDAVAARMAHGSGERVQVEGLLDVARKVAEEGRSQVLDLRAAPSASGLAAALAEGAGMLRAGGDAEVAVREHGRPRPLEPGLRAEVHAIACEAIANALRHARARCIDVVLDWSGAALVLRVADDGVGMNPELIALGRPGHWGLAGMRERAARIGAALALRNRPGGGIEVVLELAGRALAPARGRAWEWSAG